LRRQDFLTARTLNQSHRERVVENFWFPVQNLMDRPEDRDPHHRAAGFSLGHYKALLFKKL
jgi:hypothetical protein